MPTASKKLDPNASKEKGKGSKADLTSRSEQNVKIMRLDSGNTSFVRGYKQSSLKPVDNSKMYTTII